MHLISYHVIGRSSFILPVTDATTRAALPLLAGGAQLLSLSYSSTSMHCELTVSSAFVTPNTDNGDMRIPIPSDSPPQRSSHADNRPCQPYIYVDSWASLAAVALRSLSVGPGPYRRSIGRGLQLCEGSRHLYTNSAALADGIACAANRGLG